MPRSTVCMSPLASEPKSLTASPGDYTVAVTAPAKTASATLTVETASVTPPPVTLVTCADTSGIEKKFPCSPLSIGAMPAAPTSGTDAWDEFGNELYSGLNPFSAVLDPLGSGVVVVKNINRLGETEKHTTVGTTRDVAKGSTTYCAFDWLWLDQSQFKPIGWSLIWQLQQNDSPIAAVSVDKSTGRWFLKSRDDHDAGLDYDLGPVLYGRRAYFVVGVTVADSPDGEVWAWMAHDDWPDVTADPKAHRTGHQTFQSGSNLLGHHTMGIYAEHFAGSTAQYIGYFSKFGRGATAARAIEIAR